MADSEMGVSSLTSLFSFRKEVIVIWGMCGLSSMASGWKALKPWIPPKNISPLLLSKKDPPLNSLLCNPSSTL